MLKNFLLFAVSASLTLTACNSAPAPVQPQPQPQLQYPYNPDASTTESTDPRVPYRGEWLWIAAFPDETTVSGFISISDRISPSATIRNFAFGGATHCSGNNYDTCSYFTRPFDDDYAGIGTEIDGGRPYLRVDYDDGTGTNGGEPLFLAYDADGRVTNDARFDGNPTIFGSGQYGYDANMKDVVVVLVQISTEPGVTLEQPAGASALGKSTSLRAQRTTPTSLEDVAVREMRRLLDAR